jgi:hypothetical protein
MNKLINKSVNLLIMDTPEQFVTITALAGILFAFLSLLILFMEVRDLILGTRIQTKVTRIVESPATDENGHPRINRFPEIEFIDPNGKPVIHSLNLTNSTRRKPGDTIILYYRPMNNKDGYKVCAPFMWPKLILLLFLLVCALLLLKGPHM